MSTLIGKVLGGRKVVSVFLKGPYTYLDLQCLCSHGTVTTGVPLGMVKKGIGMTCRACWSEDRKRDGVRAASRVRQEMFADLKEALTK